MITLKELKSKVYWFQSHIEDVDYELQIKEVERKEESCAYLMHQIYEDWQKLCDIGFELYQKSKNDNMP